MLFPDLDLRQRLTLKSGYAVAEFSIGPSSELAHKTLRETELRERDVLVLRIQRGSVIIPNPRGSQEILPADLLLCYGKMLTLRTLIPPTEPKKRKRVRRDSAPIADDHDGMPDSTPSVRPHSEDAD